MAKIERFQKYVLNRDFGEIPAGKEMWLISEVQPGWYNMALRSCGCGFKVRVPAGYLDKEET